MIPWGWIMKTVAFHSSIRQTLSVHPSDDDCPYGRQILTKNRRAGTAGRPPCAYCRCFRRNEKH